MKAFKGYENTQTISSANRLPVGGYVLTILDVKVVEGTNGNSDKMTVSYDIAEGPQKGFYQRDYAGQNGEDKRWKGHADIWIPTDDGSERDEWTKRKFKTFIVSVEESNSGYHWDWDESKLKKKIVGGVFNDKEYDFNGKNGFYTALHHWETVEKIRNNDFKQPEPTYLKDRNSVGSPAPDGFVDVPAGDQEELPFT